MRSRDIVTGAAFLALGLAMAWFTAALPVRSLPNTPGPEFFPWVVTVAIVALALMMLARAVVRDAGAGDISGVAAEGRERSPLAAAGVLACFIVYLWLLARLGFVVATVPFFAFLMMLYGERRPAVVALGAAIATAVLYVVFRHLFQIILPQGLLAGVVP